MNDPKCTCNKTNTIEDKINCLANEEFSGVTIKTSVSAGFYFIYGGEIYYEIDWSEVYDLICEAIQEGFDYVDERRSK